MAINPLISQKRIAKGLPTFKRPLGFLGDLALPKPSEILAISGYKQSGKSYLSASLLLQMQVEGKKCLLIDLVGGKTSSLYLDLIKTSGQDVQGTIEYATFHTKRTYVDRVKKIVEQSDADVILIDSFENFYRTDLFVEQIEVWNKLYTGLTQIPKFTQFE